MYMYVCLSVIGEQWGLEPSPLGSRPEAITEPGFGTILVLSLINQQLLYMDSPFLTLVRFQHTLTSVFISCTENIGWLKSEYNDFLKLEPGLLEYGIEAITGPGFRTILVLMPACSQPC